MMLRKSKKLRKLKKFKKLQRQRRTQKKRTLRSTLQLLMRKSKLLLRQPQKNLKLRTLMKAAVPTSRRQTRERLKKKQRILLQ